jgi:hypothetical protein
MDMPESFRLRRVRGTDISARYPDAGTYVREWDAAIDRARGQGLVLDADLEELRQRGRKGAAGLRRQVRT